jgi:hypothetical protein
VAGSVASRAAWLVLLAGAALFVALGSPPGFVLTLGLAVVLFTAVSRRREELLRNSALNELLTLVPEIVVGALTSMLAFTVLGASRHTVAVVSALSLAVGAHALGVIARDRAARWRRLPVRWRNLDVPGLDGDADRSERPPTAEWLLASSILGTGIWLADIFHNGWIATVASLLAVLAAAAGAGVASLSYLKSRRPIDADEVRARAREALIAHQPIVAVYFEGPKESAHALNVWLPTLHAIRHRAVVIVRNAWHLDVPTGDVPILHLPKSSDVEFFAVDSLKVALYPTNVAKNNHLIRVPGVFDVFVGHGDSDKGGSANPISRIYDEVWVAGRAARDRYRRAQVGVRDEQVREVGRPQLMGIRRGSSRSQDGPLHVLYAPTWEGFYAAWSYSSVAGMGERLIGDLLAMPNVQVTYRPHPATGSRDAETAAADRAVRDLIARAGTPHRVVGPELSLTDAFNEADVLISDISSVVTDFLFSRKPYILCNTRDAEDEQFRNEFPSTAAAYLIGSSGDTLPDALAAIQGADPLAGAREHLAGYLLGDDSESPIVRFETAIDIAVQLQHERDAVRGVLPAEEPSDVAADETADRTPR